jgi:hypothetical protein
MARCWLLWARAQDAQLSTLLPMQEGEVAGTLMDRAVFVMPSSLGPQAGLGLYAGREFTLGERITSYAGPILYREQIEEADLDTSYADGH